tara:strand:+ start:71 stop:550 length:480 start_codon:yes stop_codon:yes gene_type:complete
MKYLFLPILFLLLFNISFGQEENFSQEIKKYFLIVSSTKDYSSALKKANSISEDLTLKLDLRGLLEGDNKLGLSWGKSVCEEDGWEYPCYAPRGRHDDGDYVSIEWSNGFQGFSEGYYIVVVASHTNYDEKIKSLLKKVKEFVPSAYIKSSMIYMGCMH